MSRAEAPAREKKVPILLDTDIGSDVDDAFALALILASPELDLRGVTTVSGDTRARALMACRLLTAAGHKDVPVAVGWKMTSAPIHARCRATSGNHPS